MAWQREMVSCTCAVLFLSTCSSLKIGSQPGHDESGIWVTSGSLGITCSVKAFCNSKDRGTCWAPALVLLCYCTLLGVPCQDLANS